MSTNRFFASLVVACAAFAAVGCSASASTEELEDTGMGEAEQQGPERVAQSTAALTDSQENSEWSARLACSGDCSLRSGTDFGLKNEYTGSYLFYQERDYGINLGWTSSSAPNFHIIGQGGPGSVIKYGDKVALQPKGHSFIKYENRRWGINLVWTSNAVYEWTVEGGAVGTPVKLNTRFGLKNATANDHVVYCTRPTGVNLRWSEDCYQVPGIDKRVPTTP
jgi:hypothetical protein